MTLGTTTLMPTTLTPAPGTPTPGTPAPGVSAPGYDAQGVFHAILEAMSHPGKIIVIDDLPDSPLPVQRASTAICQSLADFEMPLWVDTNIAACGVAMNHLRFQCGCRMTLDPLEARTALLTNGGNIGAFKRFNIGTEERPDLSATLIVQVAGMTADKGGVRLSGAGIKTVRHLAIDGVEQSFWAAVAANGTYFPRGVDFIVTANDAFVCLPRTIKVEA